MDKILGVHFDRLSFWLGFFSGSIIWLLLSKLKVDIKSIYSKINIKNLFEKTSHLNTQNKYNKELLNHVQHQHLMSSMFSLDEIIITPLLIPLPPRIEPGSPPIHEDIFTQTIPYLPDCTKLASALDGNRIPVDMALSQGANLVLLGCNGSGKTTALADLTSKIIRKQSSFEELNSWLPILIDASIYSPNNLLSNDILTPLIEMVCHSIPSISQIKIKRLITHALEDNSGILIVDGMDVLPYQDYCIWIQYIQLILERYPNIRIIATSSLDFYGDITTMGLVPVAISEWNHQQKKAYLDQWHTIWNKVFDSKYISKPEINPLYLRELILSNKLPDIPIFFVIKVTNNYFGNPSNPNINIEISNHINRLISNNTDKLLALQKIAFQLIIEEKILLQENEIDKWELKWERIFVQNPFENLTYSKLLKNENNFFRVKAGRFLSDFSEIGITKRDKNGNISLLHPIFTAYLASEAISSIIYNIDQETPIIIENRQPWEIFTNTLNLYLSYGNPSIISQKRFFEDPNPCKLNFFKYLRFSQLNGLKHDFKTNIFRTLVLLVKNETLALQLRSKALCTLISTADSAIPILLDELSKSDKPSYKLLSLFGFGLWQSSDSLTQIEGLVNDRYPQVQRASILAIAAIGNHRAFELLTDLLLNGNEIQQQGAAEVLSRNAENGHQILREYADFEDLMVRRAVIYGLQKINQDWSIQILKNLQIEEAQWVIKDAATQAINYLTTSKPFIPEPYPEISQIPWLIAFAGDRGIGISPGSQSVDLFLTALSEGTKEQTIASIDYLKYFADKSILQTFLDIYANSQGETQAYAFNAIWHVIMKYPNSYYSNDVLPIED